MAKKKKAKDAEEELDDEDFGDLGDDELEIALPKISKKKKEKDVEEVEVDYLDEAEFEEGGIEEELEPLPEFEEEIPQYKYLDVDIRKLDKENDYEVMVDGQSHGFLNILVKHLLVIKGVNMAAYKITKIDPPKIFIRLEDSKFKIKDILYEAIENLRAEVEKLQKSFSKLV